MILAGKLIDAQEVYRINLFNEVVPLDKLMSTDSEYAAAICQASPAAVRAAKEALVHSNSMTPEEGLKLETELLSCLLQTEALAEETKALSGKRKPVYRGS